MNEDLLEYEDFTIHNIQRTNLFMLVVKRRRESTVRCDFDVSLDCAGVLKNNEIITLSEQSS
jgi:hypothetical protein